MTKIFTLLTLILAFISGCASFNSQSIEFRSTANVSFEISSSQFDTVELHPSKLQLWKNSDLVGSVTTIETNPQFESAIKEVKQGFVEALKGPGTPSELALPEGTYGFASSFRGYTTAFIARADNAGSWITISLKDDAFDEVFSSMALK